MNTLQKTKTYSNGNCLVCALKGCKNEIDTWYYDLGRYAYKLNDSRMGARIYFCSRKCFEEYKEKTHYKEIRSMKR